MTDYDESLAIVDAFRQAHAEVMMSPNVHGLEVQDDGSEPTLVLVVSTKVNIKDLKSDEVMPKRFEYSFRSVSKSIATRIEERPRPKALNAQNTSGPDIASRAPVRAGDKAAGIDLQGYGTAGWTISLNSAIVVVSNWHVLCGKGNQTPIERRVLLANQNIASLYAYEPVYSGRFDNGWDFALAKHDLPDNAVGKMRPCDDGTERAYPQELSKNVQIGGTEQYWKVGARGPTCRSGKLRGVGYRTVEYHDGGVAGFVGQLVFSKMTDPGDSGSVIVRESDNSVTGLSFAGGPNESLANPLFRIGWERRGSVALDGVGPLPVFETRPDQPVMPFGRGRDQPVPFISNEVASNIPDLSAGKLFLGVAYGHATYRGDWSRMQWSDMRWAVPPPPPIEGRGPVTAVVVDYLNGSRGVGYPLQGDICAIVALCFG